MGSSLYESWITRLKVSWMGAKARGIFGGFAAALGDKSYDWAQQGVLEHLPGYASDPASIALEADGRQLDTYPGEPTANTAAREPFWLQIHQFRGRGLGTLLGLHFAGFDGAVLVQQNGRALSLTLPLPPFVLGHVWDPTPNLMVTQCNALAATLTSSVTPTRSIPAGTPWFAFDGNTDFCSRFAVLFPGPALPSSFMTFARATFSNTDAAAITWNNAFPSTSYATMPGLPTIISGPPVSVHADPATQTGAGVTIRASGAFTGTVDVLASQFGANPFADLHPSDLQRLQSTIAKWKPAKATCVGVTAMLGGELWDYPFGLTWDGDSLTWDQAPATSVQVLGAF